MANNKKIQYEITADAGSMINAIKQVDSEVKKIGQAGKAAGQDLDAAFKTLKIRPFANIQSDIQKVDGALATLKSSGQLTGAELVRAEKAAADEAKKLRNEMMGITEEQQKIKAAGQDLDAAFKTLKIRSFANIQSDIQKVDGALSLLKSSGQLTGAELVKANKAAADETKKLRNEIMGITEEQQKIIDGAKRMAGAAAAAFTAFATKKGIDEFKAVDKELRNLWTLVDEGEEEVQALGKAFVQMSTRVPDSTQTLIKAGYQAISAGVQFKDTAEAVELAAQAAVAGVSDTETAMRVGIGLVNSYGLAIDDLSKVYDSLFNLVKFGVTDFSEIAQYIGQVSSIAANSGVSLDTLSASLAVLTQQGVRLPLAVQGLKQTILGLQNPAEETAKIMEQAGIKWEGLIPTLQKLSAAGYDSVQALGKLGIPKEAINSILIMIQNVEKISGYTQEWEKTSGTASAAFEKAIAGADAQLKIFLNTINAVARDIGEVLVPVLVDVLKVLGELLKGFLGLPAPVRHTIEVMALLTAGLVSLKLAIGGLGLLKLPGLLAGTAAALTTTAGAATAAGTAVTAAGTAVTGAGAAVAGAATVGLGAAATLAAGALGWTAFGYNAWKASKETKKAGKSITTDYDKILDSTKQFRDVGVKSLEELRLMSGDELEAYGKQLIGKKQNIEAELGKATKAKLEGASFLDLVTGGADSTEGEKKLESQAAEVDKLINHIISRKDELASPVFPKVTPTLESPKTAVAESIRAGLEEGAKQGAEKAKTEIDGIKGSADELKAYLETALAEGTEKLSEKQKKEYTDALEGLKGLGVSSKETMVKAQADFLTSLDKTTAAQRDMINKLKIDWDSLGKAPEPALSSLDKMKLKVAEAAEAWDQANRKIQLSLEDVRGEISLVGGEDTITAMLGGGKKVTLATDDYQKALTVLKDGTEEQKIAFLEAYGQNTEVLRKFGGEVDTLIASLEKFGLSQNQVLEIVEKNKTVQEQLKASLAAVGAVLNDQEVDTLALGETEAARLLTLQGMTQALNDYNAALQTKEGLEIAQKNKIDLTVAQNAPAKIELPPLETAALDAKITELKAAPLDIINSFKDTFAANTEVLTMSTEAFDTSMGLVKKTADETFTGVAGSAQTSFTEVKSAASNMGSFLLGLFASIKDSLNSLVLDMSKIPMASPTGFASGGQVQGRAGKDVIPAMLSRGEYVVRREAVQKYGLGLLQALNGGRFRMPFHRFATGGAVGGSAVTSNTNLKIVNVINPSDIMAAMSTAEGEQVIMNTVLANLALVRG